MARPSSFDELLGNLNAQLYGVNGGNGSNGNGEVHYCQCEETLNSKGQRIPVPKYHDCQYVRCRTALIPHAEKIATALAPDDAFGWTRCFVEAMESLVQRCL
jgi:hypothetical protein